MCDVLTHWYDFKLKQITSAEKSSLARLLLEIAALYLHCSIPTEVRSKQSANFIQGEAITMTPRRLNIKRDLYCASGEINLPLEYVLLLRAFLYCNAFYYLLW